MMKRTLGKCTIAFTAATLNLAIVFPSFAGVASQNLIYGDYQNKTQYEWSAEWWTTFLEAPSVGNPLVSSDSNSANLEHINKPSSPVFFLTGSLDPSIQPINRTVTIPENKAVFFPLYNAFNAESVESGILPSLLCSNISPVTGNILSATLDGVRIPIDGDFTPWRQSCGDQPDSGNFVVNELPGSLLQFLAEDEKTLPYNFVSDGYWLLLTPLTLGEHTVTFGASDSKGETLQDNTYHITAVPVPEPSSILGFLALGTIGAASTLKRKLKPSNSTGKVS